MERLKFLITYLCFLSFKQIFPLNKHFFLLRISGRGFLKDLNLSLKVFKIEFSYFKKIFFFFCVAEIISMWNQGFLFAFTPTFLMNLTELVALMNLFTKSKMQNLYRLILSSFKSWFFQCFFKVVYCVIIFQCPSGYLLMLIRYGWNVFLCRKYKVMIR